MTAASDEQPVKKRRGPRKESEIRAEAMAEFEAQARAEIEAQIRAEMETKARVEAEQRRQVVEAEVPSREEIEAEVRAQIEAEQREEARAREMASDAKPVSGRDLDGDPTQPGAVTVHFVEDGFTLLGKVWYRGEELTINEGTEQWEAALYKGGPRIVLQLDEFEQEEIYGRRYFREGTWRGKGFDLTDKDLTEEERRALEKAEQIRMERYGPIAR